MQDYDQQVKFYRQQNKNKKQKKKKQKRGIEKHRVTYTNITAKIRAKNKNIHSV